MDKTLSIERDILNPLPAPIDINLIFNSDSSGNYTKDALLYQDILKLSTSKKHINGFKFTELGNWLLDHNREFLDYYSDFKKKVPRTARIANRRQRIQHSLENLIGSGLIYQKATVKSRKNEEDIPLYDFTREGKFLSCLIQCITKRENTRADMVEGETKELLHIIYSYISNDSPTLIFISNFFNLCNEKGIFTLIINHFVHKMLKSSKVYSGKDLLLLFLGIRHSLNWVVIHPESFYDALDKLDPDTRRLMIFQFKMEIEEYYYDNYLLEEWKGRQLIKQMSPSNYLTDFSGVVAIPGKEWQLMRFKNIHNESKVTIPGYCKECKSDRAFLFETVRYLDCIISAHVADPHTTISANCPVCGNKFSIFAHVINLPWFLAVWQ